MTDSLRISVLAMFAVSLAHMAQAESSARELIRHYPVRGRTGPELYASIGENGPRIGQSRVIALTTFKLTWKRDYQMRGADCVLASAQPTLVITYQLPKPANRLALGMEKLWQAFADGVARHERVHGDHIKAMVAEIEKATIGLVAKDDPGCRKIRQSMQPVLKAISDEQRRLSSQFDRVEMQKGGAVHQLILDLVNGRQEPAE